MIPTGSNQCYVFSPLLEIRIKLIPIKSCTNLLAIAYGVYEWVPIWPPYCHLCWKCMGRNTLDRLENYTTHKQSSWKYLLTHWPPCSSPFQWLKNISGWLWLDASSLIRKSDIRRAFPHELMTHNVNIISIHNINECQGNEAGWQMDDVIQWCTDGSTGNLQ